MTDPRPPTSSPTDRPAPRLRARSIPPLVWIVIFLLIAWFAWAWVQKGETTRTPQGGAAPAASPANGYMPPAPARSSAPATPPSTGTGGAQSPSGANAPAP
jgi:hypothetical protein